MVNLLGIMLALLGAAPATASSFPLTPVIDLPLPGHASRFDYQWLDSASRRLYIAHLGDSSLVVFDLDGQHVTKDVTGLPNDKLSFTFQITKSAEPGRGHTDHAPVFFPSQSVKSRACLTVFARFVAVPRPQ
jgi:hypothetical protein